jgi:hypothetical protein
MARTNKLTAGVFVNIVSTPKKVSSYDEFINTKLQNVSDETKKYLNKYKTILKKKEDDLKLLADLEEIIMQLRTRDNIDDIKLSVVREYIYARCPFYRRDKDSKDIRVIVGLTEFYGEDMKKLLGNKDFMAKAKEKLVSAIDNEINQRRGDLDERAHYSIFRSLTPSDVLKVNINDVPQEKIS